MRWEQYKIFQWRQKIEFHNSFVCGSGSGGAGKPFVLACTSISTHYNTEPEPVSDKSE